MMTYPKAIFLMLATLAASASGDTVWQHIWGEEADSALVASEEGRLGETRPFDVIHVPDRMAGPEEEYVEVHKKDDGDEKDKDKKDKEKEAKTKKPTRKPTESRSSKTNKPTRRPTSSRSSKTKKPTRKPTRQPTKKPTSKKKDKCVDDKKPSAKRNGDKYKFELEKKDARCVDGKNRYYEYGEFQKIKKFSKCADACVEDVSSSLLDTFQGFDFDCKKERCRCLYDRGTLDSRNSDRFDRTSRSEDGKGSVRSAKKDKDYYCGKLKSVKLEGMNDELDEDDDEFDEDDNEFDEEEKIDTEVSRALRGFV